MFPHTAPLVVSNGRETAELDFVNGQTEVYLSPPPGGYNLQLQWVANQCQPTAQPSSPSAPS